MIKTISIAVLGLLFITSPVYAGAPPILITPANNSTVSSIPTFSWQAVSGSTGYNILIDDEPTVISPYAKTPYYPTNPSYSPQTLNPGTYYWKVKAKDSSGNWGSFSSIWSFTLSTSTPSPTPTGTPAPTSTTSPTSTPSTSSFTISNIPSQINSDQSFNVLINLSLSDKPNTLFYLKGAFRHPDKPSNYFGLTKVGSSWVKNSVTATSQLQITTDTGGNWTGSIEVQPDSEDSGFTGTGDYIFKVGRYTSTGSGPTWSNESNIQITAVENTDQGGISSDSSSSTTAPSSSPQSGQSAKSKTASSQSKSYDRLVYLSEGKASSAYHTASVAAATTSASPPNIAVRVQHSSNFIAWIGAGLILTGISLFAYIYLRSSNLHETISNLFRKRN